MWVFTYVDVWWPEDNLSYQSLGTIHPFLLSLFLSETGSKLNLGLADRLHWLGICLSLFPQLWDYEHVLPYLAY